MDNFSSALDTFLAGKTGTFKRDATSVYTATKNALVIRRYNDYNHSANESIIVAKVNNQFLGNSSTLEISDMSNVTPEQLFIRDKLPMIPFSVIKQAGLSLGTYKEIDKGPEETIYQRVQVQMPEEEFKKQKFKDVQEFSPFKRDVNFVRFSHLEPRHFMGARLFQVDTKVFLLDVDRRELDHGIINPFLVEIPRMVNSIAEAYEILKPDAVVDALQAGLKVLRQGEWFLIPVNVMPFGEVLEDFRLRVGNNRPNRATKGLKDVNGDFFVTGLIEHTGREHAPIKLKGWYKAIPNTAMSSFTITGDVD